MRLYNTLGRTVADLGVPPGGLVRLYTCGPTVYNYLHIGNYRTYVFEDVLKRSLKFLGWKVRHVMNITDVGHLTSQADEGEDKMAVAARREGKTAWEIARFYEETFLKDAAELRMDFRPVAKPARENRDVPEDILCRATEHIEEQAGMVRRLIAGGFTYETSDGIYFDTSKLPDYGKLAGGQAHLEGLKGGTRVALGEKRHTTDFALWKFSPAGEKRQMEWSHSWKDGAAPRAGFPGWHIECSAMAQTYLGDSFDIHCGGVDHIPIHHTNEIAQAEAVTRKPFVRVWLHGEFLLMNKAKMAKSEGGFVALAGLKARGFHPLDYRYFCCTAHYRRQLEFSWEALEAAKTARRKLREKVAGLSGADGARPEEALEEFRGHLADDLNVPNALATLHEAMGRLPDPAKLAFAREAEKVLALGLTEPVEEVPLAPELQGLFHQYVAARKARDFKTSDTLRQRLKEEGIQVLDSKDGSAWKRL